MHNSRLFGLLATALLRHIRKCLDDETAKTVASSMVGARLDYCNAIYGTSLTNINKFQRIQNSLARVVTGARRYDHITPVLADLHWLKIQDRITFKIAIVTFKAVTTNKPAYLAEFISFHTPIRTLRSNNGNRLRTSNVRTAFGSCAFSLAASSICRIIYITRTCCTTSPTDTLTTNCSLWSLTYEHVVQQFLPNPNILSRCWALVLLLTNMLASMLL